MGDELLTVPRCVSAWSVALLLSVIVSGAVRAEGVETQPAKFVNTLTFPEIVGVTLLHLASDSPRRQETGKRLSDAVIITGLLTSGLKHVTHSPRPTPYQAEDDGFPSGHTSLAFAVAAGLTANEPSAGWIAFPLAAAAGWARVGLRRHTWTQVVAGAALGTYLGHQAGEGKLTLFGHSDADLPVALRTAEYDNPPHVAGTARQLTLWGTSF